MRTLLPALLLLTASWLHAQNAPPPTAPNSDPAYQQLRHIAVGSESVTVSGLVLKRPGGRFVFRSGSFYFLAPVNGKVTGAVFVGDGVLTLDPPLPMEQRSLFILTRHPEFSESFEHLVLRFTDTTYAELKQGGTPGGPAPAVAASLLDQTQVALRDKLHTNLHGRILQDVLSDAPGGLFVAFIEGKNYDGKMVYWVDRHGIRDLGVQPEEVALMTWDENKYGIWTAFHIPEEYQSGKASGTERNALVYVEHQKLDTRLEGSGKLDGDATTTLISGIDGLRVVPLNLFRSLRVSQVTDSTGRPLAFIQEEKNQDPDFYVILPQALKADERFSIHTLYSGKDAVINAGGGNYYPVAREDWYPGTYFGDYATYDMTFHVPKGDTLIATGNLLTDKVSEGQDVSEWQSEVPIAVAGFQYGKFKRQEAKLKNQAGQEFTVEAYANEEPPDYVKQFQRAYEDNGGLPTYYHEYEQHDTPVSFDTAALMKKPLAEGEAAIMLYSDYFGAVSYRRLAMSQQTACGYGQSWPTLVYLPICALFDTTTRHALHLDESMRGIDVNTYWQVVAPHEVAHQWWGHTVGFNSYRDQWMSEGFAHLSTSIFLQAIYKDKGGEAYNHFWDQQLQLLTLKNPQGARAIDVGPVTMGFRLSNTVSGFNIYQYLVYPKGAYILQMLRWMMYNQRTGDQNFKALMRDFVQTYRNKPASTEDFKAMVEKHMTPGMNLDGNGKMDWFFNEYVYGTQLPNYHFEYSFGKQDDGTASLHLKLVQSNVDPRFKMAVPLYLQLANGQVVRVGAITVFGNSTVDQTVPLGMKDTPRAAMIDYNHDVLATVDQK